ncbi:hypothetical protein ACFL5Z_08550 [Planctomycetota bacterium]
MAHFDLQLLRELVQLIDQQLKKIEQLCSEVDDPDSLGYFDRGEHVIGLGFVACQTFMSSVCGHLRISRRSALAIGPSHPGGNTKAQIINHAANYWKHHNEWNPIKTDRRRESIEKAFNSVGFSVDLDYPLSNVLAELSMPGKVRFQSVLSALEVWKDEVESLK